jgi:hypothetical protein
MLGGEMGKQLTLVSHYGAKPPAFARLLEQLLGILRARLGNNFHPYTLEQVHGTIVGLEGTRTGAGVRNENLFRLRGEERPIDFAALLDFVRNKFPTLHIQVGAFPRERDFGFLSQCEHPFFRSSSIRNGIAVAMGWPMNARRASNALDDVRRAFLQCGVLHKWHQRPDAIDNDFFFVLGRVADAPPESCAAAEAALREELAAMPPLLLPVSSDHLSFVAYDDPQLPPATSRAWLVTAQAVTPEMLSDIY